MSRRHLFAQLSPSMQAAARGRFLGAGARDGYAYNLHADGTLESRTPLAKLAWSERPDISPPADAHKAMTPEQIVAAILEAPTETARRLWCTVLYQRGQVDGVALAVARVQEAAS